MCCSCEYKIVASFIEFCKGRTINISRFATVPLFDDNQPIGLFNGVEQHLMCSASMTIYISWNHVFNYGWELVVVLTLGRNPCIVAFTLVLKNTWFVH